MSKIEKILLFANFAIWTVVTVFSYSYVDLNLTLSKNDLMFKFIESMQLLGYYHRPLATSIYTLIILISFAFFCLNLILFYKNKIGNKYLTVSSILNTLILVFAYPFLSYDLFNYMFDAKIVWLYHANPYTHRPLDFPLDDWLRFMRWVHRYSPYGPLWLMLSLIPSIAGLSKFALTLASFKIFIAAFHLLNIWVVYRILQKTSPKLQLVGTAFYALNPLILIEGVANSHNDVLLATFMLLIVYFLSKNKLLLSYAALLFGVLIKYLPALILPWLIFETLSKKPSAKRFTTFSLVTLVIFTYLFSSFKIAAPFISSGATQVQFQPWYLFWTVPYVALVPKRFLIMLGVSICLGASLRYLPFLFYGEWSQPYAVLYMQFVTLSLPVIAIFILIKRHLLK